MTMHSQYDGVHWVAKLVRYLVELVQNDLTLSAGRSAASWAELLTFKPRTYLRLALAMDLSMSSGRIPDHEDFPARLEAKLLRALAGPESGGGALRAAAAPRRETVTGAAAATEDLELSADFFHFKGKTPNNRPSPGLRQEGGAETAVVDILGEAEQEQSSPTFDGEMNLDDGIGSLGALPAEMDSFFDPVLEDLAVTGEHAVEDLSRDFASDVEAAMLTNS